MSLRERLLADDGPPTARGEHSLDHCEPVVGLVVEDAVGNAVRLLLPRPHELRAVVSRVGEGRSAFLRCGRVAPGRNRVVGAPERPGTLGLHRLKERGGGECAERSSVVKGFGARTCERAASDLHDEAVDRLTGRGDSAAIS